MTWFRRCILLVFSCLFIYFQGTDILWLSVLSAFLCVLWLLLANPFVRNISFASLYLILLTHPVFTNNALLLLIFAVSLLSLKVFEQFCTLWALAAVPYRFRQAALFFFVLLSFWAASFFLYYVTSLTSLSLSVPIVLLIAGLAVVSVFSLMKQL